MPSTQEKIATLFDKLTLEEKAAAIRMFAELFHEEAKAEKEKLAKLSAMIPENGKHQ